MKTSLKAALVATALVVGVLSTPAMANDRGYGDGDRSYASRDHGDRDSYGGRDGRHFDRDGRHGCDGHHRRHVDWGGGRDRRHGDGERDRNWR